jgi:hypothetical protein
MECQSPPHSRIPGQKFKRIIYIEPYLITLDFWPTIDQDPLSNELRLKFFNSFEPNMDQFAQESESENSSLNLSEHDTSYKIGYLLGQAFAYLLLFGVPLGIYFLIQRRKNKREKE